MPFDLPDSLESAVPATPEETRAQARLSAALQMFERGELSSGKAAERAGIARARFLEICGQHRVPMFNCAPSHARDELTKDLDVLRKTER
jgi:predicted HTH domain antitoxin